MTTSTAGPVLLGLDVHGIQRFLFATSKLREVIGASRIVDDFTGAQSDDAPARCLQALNLTRIPVGTPTGDTWYLPVRLGGGVVRVVLPSAALAKRFVRSMSEWSLERASGLEFDADWVVFDLATGNYAEANADLIQRINARRQATSGGNGFNGFPFSAPCRLTGDPAEGYGGPNERLCRASLDKRAYQATRDDRWVLMESQPILKKFKTINAHRPFIFDLESMQGDGPSDSYMAVVALDINSLGEAGKQAIGDARGVAALHRLHALVEQVTKATTTAFVKAIDDMASDPESHEFEAIKRTAEQYDVIPLRPLVFGGDDLTFVMHAALAPRFAHSLASSLDRAGFKSGVGIAIVKTKSPLSRAIELAEQLLARAKRAGREHTHVDFMLCSAEIPSDANDRDASGERPARGPYDLEGFTRLRENARRLKRELPSSHVRGAADGFQRSLADGRELLKDLLENVARGIGGGAGVTAAARELLGQLIEDDEIAATYLDCVDLFRFIEPRGDNRSRAQSAAPTKEVTA